MSTMTQEKNFKTMKSINRNSSNNETNKPINKPPMKAFREFLFCRHFGSINRASMTYGCPYEFDDKTHVCWRATTNGSIASATIEYDYGPNRLFTIHHGIGNCTLERFCHLNGTWADVISPDIQCKSCIADGQPLKFNSISIIIETLSLSVSLISLSIAVLCLMSINRTYSRRLHLPRNLLHMHLFIAFILRSIVKLIFIHTIVSGYTRNMIVYTFDKCGHIEILSQSLNLFHIFGCRLLASLYWYSDAAAQTFVFCEAIFLFTALTSHLFRDRGCLPFVLWGWLSPIMWLSMWVIAHIVTDHLEQRSSCWLEGDLTTYFYYFFYIPYAIYLLINLGVFLFLVRLLYSKYQSNPTQTNRTGNRHLIRSILILIPLFGLHSLLIIWIFYRKNEGHTIWYYITVIFKATFGDLQGFFASLIYFYFNGEIRCEVFRHIERRLLNSDTGRFSSTGETLSTRLSTFRRSFSRHRQTSLPNRHERFRPVVSKKKRSLSKPIDEMNYRKCPLYLSPSWIRNYSKRTNLTGEPLKPNPIDEECTKPIVPVFIADVVADENIIIGKAAFEPAVQSFKLLIDGDAMTCDTMVVKNEHEDDLFSDENDVTVHLSSMNVDPISIASSNHMPLLFSSSHHRRVRSNSDGYRYKIVPLVPIFDTLSLK